MKRVGVAFLRFLDSKKECRTPTWFRNSHSEERTAKQLHESPRDESQEMSLTPPSPTSTWEPDSPCRISVPVLVELIRWTVSRRSIWGMLWKCLASRHHQHVLGYSHSTDSFPMLVLLFAVVNYVLHHACTMLFYTFAMYYHMMNVVRVFTKLI